jgi:hypothetical protein
MRRLLIGVLAAALLLGGLLLALLRPLHCPVSRAACEQVKEGMTQAEVEAILGVPAGDYRTRPTEHTYILVLDGESTHMGVGTHAAWIGDEGDLSVWVVGGVVREARWMERSPVPGLFELLRWRLEWLKKRWLE